MSDLVERLKHATVRFGTESEDQAKIRRNAAIAEAATELTRLRAQVAALEADKARLRDALVEIDDAMGEDDDEYPDTTMVTLVWGRTRCYGLTLGHLRAARAALQETTDAT